MTSVSPRLEKRRRTFVRLLGEIHHALNAALSEEKEKRGLNKTQIAALLGLDRSSISKKFDGRHNMTLETLADLAFALDRPVKVTLPERAQALSGSNRVTARASVATRSLGSIENVIKGDGKANVAYNIPVFATFSASQGSSQPPYGLASVRQAMREEK